MEYGHLEHVEGSGIEVLEPEFKLCFVGHTRVERLWRGARWCEGPAWFAAGRYLVWSDIPNNRMLRWDDTDGSVSDFRIPCNNTNGNTVDYQGRLLTCEHLTRRVTRTEHNGTITVLADQYEGKALNSPNDIVVHSDGSIWFTDPDYGIGSDYEGLRADPEQDGCHVYRIDTTGSITRVASDFSKPNGICFSEDEKFLYISDTGATHEENGPAHIRRFSVDSNAGKLSGGEVFAECTNGLFDGFRCDTMGRIWSSAGDGVHCHATNGDLIGKIVLPEMAGNLTFGGTKRNRLFICGTTSLYSVIVTANGAAPG